MEALFYSPVSTACLHIAGSDYASSILFLSGKIRSKLQSQDSHILMNLLNAPSPLVPSSQITGMGVHARSLANDVAFYISKRVSDRSIFFISN